MSSESAKIEYRGAYPGSIQYFLRPNLFYFTLFCMNSSILSVERPSKVLCRLDTICDLAIPWVAEDHGMPYKLNLLPCARTQNPAHANAPLASFLVFRRMPSFGCSKNVYKIDRGSRFVSLLASHAFLQSISALGPVRDASRFCILSHLFRSTPPPSFPLFPPHPDYNLCRLGTADSNCGKAVPRYTRLHIPAHSGWGPTR
jgi:hypothetical protein